MKADEWCRTFLESSGWVQLVLWFLIVFILEYASLLAPPVWDSAMGIFPPAIYLYENQFDIVALLAEENWWLGGPNVHSLSLLTWVIAIVMKLTQSAVATFATIHVLTFVAFAWALVLYCRTLLAHDLAPSTVLLAASFVLLMPVVLVQVGYLYTEIFVLVFGIAAWSRWREGRPIQAFFFCTIGLFVKPTAIPIAACLFLVVLASERRHDLRHVLMICALPMAIGVQQSLPRWLGATRPETHGWGESFELFESLFERLALVPDLAILLFLGLSSSLVYFIGGLLRVRGFGFLTNMDRDASSRFICFAMPLVFTAGVLVQVFGGNLFLPRYIVPLVPFAVASLLLLVASFGRERIASAIILGASLFSAANYQGSFYPTEMQKFSVVERSHAYRSFHDLQVKAIASIVGRPEQIPVFVTREIGYMISHPMMGYVQALVPNVFPIYRAPYIDWVLAEFPDEFILLQANRYHGGKRMWELVYTAARSGQYRVQTTVLESRGFTASLYWLKKKPPAITNPPAIDIRAPGLE